MKFVKNLLLLTLLVLSFSAYSQSADQLILKAQQAFTNNAFTTALIHLKNAAKDNPRNLNVRLELVKLFVYTGQGIQAQIEVDKAIRLGATQPQIKVLEAKTQLLLGNFDDITDGFNFIDLPQHEIARIRALQGHAFYEKREFQQARLMFQRAYLLDPTSMEVQLGQARLYNIDGNDQQEKLLIEALLKQYPNHPEVQLIAGEYYRDSKQYDRSLKLFKKAGEVQLSNVNVWFGVVRSYIGLNQLEKAKNEINVVLTNFPEHQVGNYLLAVIAYQQNDLKRARAAAEIVLKGKKRNFEALKLLATIQFQQQEYSSAEANLKKFLKFNPNNIQAQKTLAAIYLKRNQGVLAVETLKPLEDTNDPFIFSMLANAYEMIGSSQKSAVYLKKALESDPNNAVIKRQFIKTQLKSGKTVDITFNDPEYTDFFGEGYLPILNLIRQKDYSAALNIIKGYQKNIPDNALLMYFQARIQLYKNDVATAKQSFIKSLKLDPELIESRINLARIYMQENNDRAAEKEYLSILKIDANNDSALISLAGIANRADKEDDMLKWLNKSRRYNTASLASREVLVDHYKSKNNITKAVEISKEMIGIQPENITLLIKHANNLKLSGRPDLAVKTYKKVVELRPNDPLAWYGLGKMQSFDNDHERSYKSFEKMLSIAPKSLVAQIILTQFDLKANNHEQALERAKNIVKTHPNVSDGYDTLGDVYIAMAKPDQAIKQYKKSINLKFNTKTYIKLFSAYNRNKQLAKGFNLLQGWVKEFPDDLSLKEVLAITHQRRGEYKKSQELYEQIIKKERRFDRIFNNLALVTLAQNSPMSMEYADIAYNINNKNALNLDTLGWVHLQNGNTNEALKFLSDAVKIAPGNPDIRYRFALALEKAEKFNDAKSQLAVIVSIEGAFKNRTQAKALFKKLNALK